MKGQRSDSGKAKIPRISGAVYQRQTFRDLGRGLWLTPDLPLRKLPKGRKSTTSKGSVNTKITSICALRSIR